MLSLLIFLPFVALIALLALPNHKYVYFKQITIGTTAIQFLISLFLFLTFVPGSGLQFVEKMDWILLDLGNFGKIKADYFLGIDGINVSMILLTGIVMLVGAVASWNIKENAKGYFALYLVLCSTIFGCFLALDFLLFFIFFEFMLLPMYFLIGMWGGVGREYASIKFFLYTLAGSIFILLVMVGLLLSVADPQATMATTNSLSVDQVKQLLASGIINPKDMVHSFNILHMADATNFIPGSLLHGNSYSFYGYPLRTIAFLALFIGFMIKLPMVPFHTWLPDAHVEAPTPISVVLAGILLKIGGYGIFRLVYPIFPDGAVSFSFLFACLGVISIIYGGLNALAMKDLKKMIAYSSVSHMGFVLLGLSVLTVEGLNGAMYQMFSHGLLSTLLFLIAGVLYDRTHDRLIDNYRGLAVKMPIYTSVVMISFFASFGLPGFSGFIAELFVILGAFNADKVNGLIPVWIGALATIGIILGAAYFLWTLQRMFFGKFWIKIGVTWKEGLYDLTVREKWMLFPLVALVFLFGVYPSILLDSFSGSIRDLVHYLLVFNSI